jgi:hypothetical protein
LITDLKWGTPSPVLLRDPDFGPLRVRAFGTYTLRALDPKRLLEQLVGTDASFESDEIGELLRSIIATAFADLVAKSEIALVDLSKNYQSLSDRLRDLVRTRIDDEYGLEIPQLYIVNVSAPAEVEQALDARSSMNVIGDTAAYQAYQLGRSMPVAAANPAGGLAGAGVGADGRRSRPRSCLGRRAVRRRRRRQRRLHRRPGGSSKPVSRKAPSTRRSSRARGGCARTRSCGRPAWRTGSRRRRSRRWPRSCRRRSADAAGSTSRLSSRSAAGLPVRSRDGSEEGDLFGDAVRGLSARCARAPSGSRPTAHAR